jgi:hypothetical protein
MLTTVLRRLDGLVVAIGVSVAFFNAGFFVTASYFGLTDREVLVGVLAGAVSGLCVLGAVGFRGAPWSTQEPLSDPQDNHGNPDWFVEHEPRPS